MKYKKFFSFLLATVMLFSLTAVGSGTAFAENADVVTVGQTDVDVQINLIYSMLEKLEQKDVDTFLGLAEQILQ